MGHTRRWPLKKKWVMPTDILERITDRKEMFPDGRFVILHPDTWELISGCIGIMQECEIVNGAYSLYGLQVMIDGQVDKGVAIVR